MSFQPAKDVVVKLPWMASQRLTRLTSRIRSLLEFWSENVYVSGMNIPCKFSPTFRAETFSSAPPIEKRLNKASLGTMGQSMARIPRHKRTTFWNCSHCRFASIIHTDRKWAVVPQSTIYPCIKGNQSRIMERLLSSEAVPRTDAIMSAMRYAFVVKGRGTRQSDILPSIFFDLLPTLPPFECW